MTERTRRMLYGRRKGPKLSAHQQHLLDRLLPQFELHLRPGADPRTYFLPPLGGEAENSPALRSPVPAQGEGDIAVEDVWLEVGFGGGEHLIWQAQQHANIGLIGAEPYVNGVVKLLAQIDSLFPSGGEGQGEADIGNQKTAIRNQKATVSTSSSDFRLLKSDFRNPPHPSPLPEWGSGRSHWNIRIYTDDARDILEALPDESIGRVFILFPDPWPKTRHHKRRFIQMETLDQLARVMKPGSELRFASDDAAYVQWTLERFMGHPAFEWSATRVSDWQVRPADWPSTRYEAKQLHGNPVFLRFCRR